MLKKPRSSRYRRVLLDSTEAGQFRRFSQLLRGSRVRHVKYDLPRSTTRFFDYGRIYLQLPCEALVTFEVRGRPGSHLWIHAHQRLWEPHTLALLERFLVRSWELGPRRTSLGPADYSRTLALRESKEDWIDVVDQVARALAGDQPRGGSPRHRGDRQQ